jgi:excisionase family DNA binding protein
MVSCCSAESAAAEKPVMRQSQTLTPVQAARLLGLTRQRVYQLLRDRKLPTCPVAITEHRIPIEAVEAMLATRQTKKTGRSGRAACVAEAPEVLQ